MIHIERIVNRILCSNTYVIFADGSNDIWLVDIGDAEKVIDICQDQYVVRGVFLTHTHFDHLYGINKLYVKFPEMVVYVAASGVDALFSSKKNLSKYHDAPIEYKGSNIEKLYDGSFVELFPEIKLKAISTPGHTSDSMSFLIRDRFLFTGDAYIPNIPVVSKLPGGNKVAATESRRLLMELSQGKNVYPGHGAIVYAYKHFNTEIFSVEK